MRLRIFHSTRYTYPAPAVNSHHEARLMPISDNDQTCLDFRLAVEPPSRLIAYDLPTGRVHHFDVTAPHREMTINAESLVVTHRHDPFASLQRTADDGEFYRREGVRRRYAEYLLPTERVSLHSEADRIAAVVRRHAGSGTASFLIALTRALHRIVTYRPGASLNTTLAQVFAQKQGVCRDFVHLMLAVCRRQGIPARYISGYLYTGERASSVASNGPHAEDRPGKDGMLISGNAMHAWVECLLPDERWHGFDPTNNLLTNDYYVKVHYGRDYGDVPPVRGVYFGPAEYTLDVSVRVIADR